MRLLLLPLMLGACGASPATVAPIENRHVTPQPFAVDPPPTADPAPAATPSALSAASLLSEADIAAVTGYTGAFTVAPLGVESAGETTQHFRADGEQEPFDVALRLWTFDGDTAAARAYYDSLVTTLPSAVAVDEIASRSLRAAEGQILGIAFLDEPRAVVALLTCGDQQCADVEMAVSLARQAHRRLD